MPIHGTIGAVSGSIKIGASGAAVTTVLDENNMSSDSATSLATQQSIKAYVDASTPATLGAITNVNTTDSAKAAGHVLVWDNSSSRWENAAISGTTNEVNITLGDGAITVGMPDDVTVGGDLTITGDLTVNGATATVDVTNLTVEDPLIKLNKGDTTSPTRDQGLIFSRGNGSSADQANRVMIWDESEDHFIFGVSDTEAGTTSGNITVGGYADLKINNSILAGNQLSGSAGGNITLGSSGQVEVAGNLTIGLDIDGTDRKVTFGHSTLKTSIGIDDSADVFAINTDTNFESGNDLEIDASGNVTIGNGDLKVAGGDIYGPTDAQLRIRTDTDVIVQLDADNDSTSKFAIWNNSEASKFEIDESGNVQMDGSVTIGSNTILASDGGTAITLDTSDNVTIGNNLILGNNTIKNSDNETVLQVDADQHILIQDRIKHISDDDTQMRFPSANKISFEAGGVGMMLWDGNSAQKAVIINESSADHDFRVEGNNDAYSLFVEGSSDFVGIGVSSPATKLHVKGDVTVQDGSSSDTIVKAYASSDDGVIDVYANNAVTSRIHGNGASYVAGEFTVGTDLTVNGEIKATTISFTDGDDAITIEDGGYARLPNGLKYNSSVKVADSSGADNSQWVKILTTPTLSGGNAIGANGVWLLSLVGAGVNANYRKTEYYILSVGITHLNTSPYYYTTSGPELTIESVGSSDGDLYFDPTADLKLTHEAADSKVFEVWIQEHTGNVEAMLMWLGGRDNNAAGGYDGSNDPYNFSIATNQTWGSFVSRGTDHTGTFAKKKLGALTLGSVAATSILDEDNLASDSAAALATQQSIKAYVDTAIAAVDTEAMSFVLEDGDGTEVTINKNNEVKFTEGTGIEINWTDIDNGTDADPYDLEFSVDVSDFLSNGSNNRIVTATGADAMNAEANLTFDGTDLYTVGKVKTTGLEFTDGDNAINITDGGFVEIVKGFNKSNSVLVGEPGYDSASTSKWIKVASASGVFPSSYGSLSTTFLIQNTYLGTTTYAATETFLAHVRVNVDSSGNVNSSDTDVTAELITSHDNANSWGPSKVVLSHDSTADTLSLWVQATDIGARVHANILVGTNPEGYPLSSHGDVASAWQILTGQQWAASVTSEGTDVTGIAPTRGPSTFNKINITSTQDVEASSATAPALIIGDAAGQHLAFDNNELMSKSDGTTAGVLYLQNNGGAGVYIGGANTGYGGLVYKGKGDTINDGFSVYADSSTSTLRLWSDASDKRHISGGSSDNGTIYLNESGGDLVIGDDLYVKGTSSSNTTDARINTSTGQLFHYSSTRKVKNSIVNSNVGLSEIMKLQAVTYERNSEPGVNEVGLIAEDVRSALGDDYVILGPDYVYDENGDYVWIDNPEDTAEGAPMCRKKKLDSENLAPQDWDYRSVITALIGSVQDLKEENDSLKARIEALES